LVGHLFKVPAAQADEQCRAHKMSALPAQLTLDHHIPKVCPELELPIAAVCTSGKFTDKGDSTAQIGPTTRIEHEFRFATVSGTLGPNFSTG